MASENPLFTNTGEETLFRAILQLGALPPGDCLRNSNDLRDWISQATIDVKSRSGALFGFTAGPASSATADDRDKLRILFDAQGRFLGPALFIPEVQNWSLSGVPGELKTVVRSEITVAEDMMAKALAGWVLCDGSNVAAPDLSATQTISARVDETTPEEIELPNPHFQRDSEDGEWNTYTVMKLN